MKKVFVSIPLKGRSKEDIQASLDKIKDAVKGLFDKEVEILHQDVKDLPDFEKGEDGYEENLAFLAKDIELMAEADYLATIDCCYDYRHCFIEKEIFERYHAKSFEEQQDSVMKFSLNIIAPDVAKKEREEAKKLWGERALRDVAMTEEEKEVVEERENKD